VQVVGFYPERRGFWSEGYYSGEIQVQHIVEQQQLSRRRYVAPHVATKIVFPDGGLEVMLRPFLALFDVCCVQWLNGRGDYERFCHAEDFSQMQEEGVELSADSRFLAKEAEDWRKLQRLRQEQWRRALGRSRSVGLEW
jgi:hypothetical protein